MATSKTRTTTTTTRRTTSRAPGKTPKGGDVEVVEEAGGMDLDTGIGIVTTLLLIAALLLLDFELGKNLGAGIVFKPPPHPRGCYPGGGRGFDGRAPRPFRTRAPRAALDRPRRSDRLRPSSRAQDGRAAQPPARHSGAQMPWTVESAAKGGGDAPHFA
jgi:hypothetical protein